jgi:hypothetical protein
MIWRNLAILLIIIGCTCFTFTNSPNPVKIKKKVTLDSIPSGSALLIWDSIFFLAGDDSPWLYRYSRQNGKYQKLPLSNLTGYYKIPSALKPDYESLSEGTFKGEPSLIVFGSGSLSPARDSVVFINITDFSVSAKFSLSKGYKKIRQENNQAEMINLEGAVIYGNSLFLFDRQNNMIIQTDWPAFVNTLDHPENLKDLKFTYYHADLPSIEGVRAGFSGVSQVTDKNRVLFTASVEKAVPPADGEILGSFIGILNLDSLFTSKAIEKIYPVKNDEGLIEPNKLESIDILKVSKEKYLILAVADNDMDSTVLLEMEIER